MSEMELYDALPRLTVPTLVIAGENDRLTPPSHAERIAEALPQLERLIVLPDTGHMGPLERPREVSQALAELAARRRRSSRRTALTAAEPADPCSRRAVTMTECRGERPSTRP